jgi:hypothetical protein
LEGRVHTPELAPRFFIPLETALKTVFPQRLFQNFGFWKGFLRLRGKTDFTDEHGNTIAQRPLAVFLVL